MTTHLRNPIFSTPWNFDTAQEQDLANNADLIVDWKRKSRHPSPGCTVSRFGAQVGFEDGKSSEKATTTGNKIIHGDNLEALKSLLPEYENKIKCIYIDPPYNTGNEGWVYNDNVNDPKISKWLKTVVGKEGEDLSRHDKWLCMMYPRLKLLHKLLAEDGAIFISIDDNEQANLKLICDEIFGGNNFLGTICWQKRTSPDARLHLGAAHDFVIAYAKNLWQLKPTLKRVPPNDERAKAYKNPDNDPRGVWASVDLTGQTGHATPDQFYEIISPSGIKLKPPQGRCWALAQRTLLGFQADNRIWFGKNGESHPRLKKFLSESEGVTTWTWWPHTEVGNSQEATKELNEAMQCADVFDNPKPTRLIQRILQLATDVDSIVIDSFAGSGTTAHSLFSLNKQDNGSRKIILIEMEDYAETITAERVRRVINGYGDKPGTGGGFDYYELGEPLFLPSGDLNEAIPAEEIRAYVYYTETGLPVELDHQDNPFYCGTANSTAFYFYYEKDSSTCLDKTFLAKIKTKAEQYLIYADNCLLTESFMKKKNIIFKKIPRDITRF